MNRPKTLVVAVLAAILASSRFGAEAAKQCYYPNGNIATDDSPCNPDDDASSCCGGTSGAQCLSNNVCLNPGGNVVRGTCTDQNWNSVECPRFCVLNPKLGPDLISCSNVTNTDTSYCCDHDPGPCCDSGNGRFDIFPSHPEVLARWDTEFRLFTTVQQTTSSSSSSASSSSSTTTTPSATSTQSQPHSSHPTSSPTTATTGTKPPVETTPSSSTFPQSSSSSPPSTGLSTAAKAGIGVGAALIGLALIALAFVFLNRHNKKKRQLLAEKDQSHLQQQGQYGAQGGQVYYEAEGGQGGWYGAPGPGQVWATKLPQEMNGNGDRHELYTEERTAELPSHSSHSWRG
ncbi:hypothetical protein B0J18DRAFT_60615 [Chaetomium sp. MPI-SDFR-AT-0129]|nr:hypothetical protein B0J18DRAFT_60615 [Chaetomium sp. MPI-SDFR-AT-0129]